MKNKKSIILSIVVILIISIILAIFYYCKRNKTYNLNLSETQKIESTVLAENTEIEDYYTNQITNRYNKITQLDNDYTIEQAKSDNCFVINNARVYNENLYEEFMRDYQNKKFAFVRLVRPTVEGDICIYDIKYNNETDKIIIVKDNTRDEFSEQYNRKIVLEEYEKIGKYKYGTNIYLVAYNGELNDTAFKTDNIFILCVIN